MSAPLSRNLQGKLTTREMQLVDLDAVVENETRAYAFLWSRGIFADCLNSDYLCRVLLYQDRVVGHLILNTVVTRRICSMSACAVNVRGQVWAGCWFGMQLTYVAMWVLRKCFLRYAHPTAKLSVCITAWDSPRLGCARSITRVIRNAKMRWL